MWYVIYGDRAGNFLIRTFFTEAQAEVFAKDQDDGGLILSQQQFNALIRRASGGNVH